MFCSMCGKTVPDNSVFCWSCGSKIEKTNEDLEASSVRDKQEDKKTGITNTPQYENERVYCDNCGNLVPKHLRYCNVCNSSIRKDAKVISEDFPAIKTSHKDEYKRDIKLNEVCPNCGNPVQGGSHHCGICGKTIGKAEYNPMADDSKSDSDKRGYFERLSSSGTASPVSKTISKKEYFVTMCSERAKKLINISWVIFIIAGVIGVIGFFNINKMELVNHNGVMYSLSEIEDLVEQNEVYYSYEIEDNDLQFQASPYNELLEFVSVAFILFRVLLIFAVICGFVSCLRQSLGFAITFLVFEFWLFEVTTVVSLGLAIALVVMMAKLHNEYKQYLKEINSTI